MKNWLIALIMMNFALVLVLGACTATAIAPIEVTRPAPEVTSPAPESIAVTRSAIEATRSIAETKPPTPTAVILPTAMPLPGFLYVVFPERGATYTLAEFEKLTEEYGSIIASGEVFFDVNMEELIEEGDFFDEVEEFFPRIRARIDDQLHTEPQDYLRTDGWYTEYLDPETGEPLYRLPAGRPFRLYYPMEREPGVHTVMVEIRKTSGEVVSYTWSFLLTE